MTPMQSQYKAIKDQHPDEIVFFRLGDFYEAFNSDAETISKVLGITLTGRGKNENRIPMAGIPHHALDNYLPKLVKAGYKVAIVDQLTEPKPGQLVERDVSKVFTAGTLTEENTLSESENNYLASVVYNDKEKIYGVAFSDISTGKLQVFQTNHVHTLKTELGRLTPAEVIAPQEQVGTFKQIFEGNYSPLPEGDFDFDFAYQTCLTQLETTSLKGFGIEEEREAIRALGALIKYLMQCQKASLQHLKTVSQYQFSDYMHLDWNTIRNLELIYPISGNDMHATVFAILNQCETNMGKRKLHDWLLRPYLKGTLLEERWSAVDAFYQDSIWNEKVRAELREVADIERIVGRIGVGSANARDLLGLKDSLVQIQNVAKLLAEHAGSMAEATRLLHLSSQLEAAAFTQEIIDLISSSINQDPPATITEGHIIASGYNAEVDELRELRRGGRDTLSQIQAREVARTGITSLKVSYNKVFGYYIEITKSNASKVPADYIRKQTLTNAERYITPELKEWEEKILTAEDKLLQLEYELFTQLRSQIAERAKELLFLADVVAELDVFANFAYLAKQYNYVKPELSEDELKIVNGRHPVVERLQEEFVPNDVQFDSGSQLIILTGPNMSGKSTYIRQIALITLLAQIGSFVPATEMKFTLVDRIFTRVGASDNLSRGESTFMVEMNETANILNNATANSLIILDEVGRGTSTYDGVAIAWAIVEYLYKEIGAKTLFATHYHELIALEKLYPGIKNYNVLVKEDGAEVLFQHKIAKGSTSRSYGVHVASLAGVPKTVLERANQILADFENGSAKQVKESKQPAKPKKIAPEQLGLLGGGRESPSVDSL